MIIPLFRDGGGAFIDLGRVVQQGEQVHYFVLLRDKNEFLLLFFNARGLGERDQKKRNL